MLKIINILLLLALSSALHAQITLHGKVTDKSGKGLGLVNVYIPELEKGTVTTDDGGFQFENTGSGIIRVQCSLLGYLTVVKTVDLKRHREKDNEENEEHHDKKDKEGKEEREEHERRDKHTETDHHEDAEYDVVVILEPTNIDIEEIVVTSNHSELGRNIPYPLSAVSAEELQESGQPTLMETLAQQPGVDIISGGGGIGKPVIRGLSFNRIVFYNMGTKIENQQWDDDHDAGIGEAGLDKVEIVYGPSALIYGADALGGAVVFVDEKPAPTGKTTGYLKTDFFSNTLGINAGAGIRGTVASGFFYSADLSNQSHTDYMQGQPMRETSPHHFAANSRFNNLNAKAKIGISRHWGVMKLSYSYLRALNGLIVDEEEARELAEEGQPFRHRSREFKGPSQDRNNHIVSSENTFLTGQSKLNVNFAFQTHTLKEFEPVEPGEDEFIAMGLKLRTYTYELKWTSSENRKFGVTAGTQGMIQMNRNFAPNIAVPDANVNNFALYAVLRYNPDKDHKWNLLGGLRFDIRTISVKATDGESEGEATLDSLEHEALLASNIKRPEDAYKKHYYPVTFSLGAAYHPVSTLTLKANVATGFSAPNYAELSTYGKHEGTTRFELGNVSLKTEQNVEGDLNAIWETRNFSMNVSGFYNYIRDFIYFSPTSDTIADLQVVAYKQSAASIYGGTFGINIRPEVAKWFELNSALTLMEGKLSDGSYLPYFPANKLVTELELEAENLGKLEEPYIAVIMNNHFAQNHPARYEESTRGYNLFDIRTGAEFNFGNKIFAFSIFCTNIFDTPYFNHLSIVKDIGVREKGRNVGFRLQLRFN